jgi:hypothetical protein
VATLDPVWAEQLATTAATTMPAAVWAHVDVLLAVDTPWAESLLWQAVSASPYVAQTIEKMPATAALVYLGNCGSYMLLETILRKAPKAHILTTKGIGTITINDPLLKALNDYLLKGKDMTWQSFWRQAEATLGRNPRFIDYVPPGKNAGAVFLTAYRSFMTAK